MHIKKENMSFGLQERFVMFLINLSGLGRSTQAVFLKIRNDVTQLGGFAKLAKIKAIVDFSSSGE